MFAKLKAAALAAAALAAPALGEDHRIVSVGGDVTEIVYALGYGDQIVATDSTSVYPPEAGETPKVGYVRSLAAESLLSLDPSILLLGGAAGPEAVVEQLRDVGLDMVTVDDRYTIDAVRTKVRQVADALGAPERAEALIADIDADWERARAEIDAIEGRPLGLFFAALGDSGPQAAGTETAGHAVLEILGVENAFASHQGYRALSMEAAVAADPDVIFVMSHNVRALGGLDAVANHPALALTSAGREGRIVAVDSVRVMSFGPRAADGLADAARDLKATLQAPVVQ
ncbi:MAG: heme/hemin ABC transporter substrate-binding protein [Oceanicaulis sp.]